MHFRVETEQEEDGRWMAEIAELPGALTYGETQEEALEKVKALALRILADRIEHGEAVPEISEAFSVAA
jgi:predicted RNase H-like HicB family nuclease